MPACFLDRSALIKVFAEEVGSEWMRQLAAPHPHPIHVTDLVAVETLANFAASWMRRPAKAGGHCSRSGAASVSGGWS